MAREAQFELQQLAEKSNAEAVGNIKLEYFDVCLLSQSKHKQLRFRNVLAEKESLLSQAKGALQNKEIDLKAEQKRGEGTRGELLQ